MIHPFDYYECLSSDLAALTEISTALGERALSQADAAFLGGRLGHILTEIMKRGAYDGDEVAAGIRARVARLARGAKYPDHVWLGLTRETPGYLIPERLLLEALGALPKPPTPPDGVTAGKEDRDGHGSGG